MGLYSFVLPVEGKQSEELTECEKRMYNKLIALFARNIEMNFCAHLNIRTEESNIDGPYLLHEDIPNMKMGINSNIIFN